MIGYKMNPNAARLKDIVRMGVYGAAAIDAFVDADDLVAAVAAFNDTFAGMTVDQALGNTRYGLAIPGKHTNAVQGELYTGVSINNRTELLEEEPAGLAFYSVSPVYPSRHVMEESPIEHLAGLTTVVQNSDLPVVAMGGITVILNEAQLTGVEKQNLAEYIRDVTRAADVAFMIADDVALAAAVRADGVYITDRHQVNELTAQAQAADCKTVLFLCRNNLKTLYLQM
ncbi:thiamine phosphate synthase [Weissella confusa]|uniref:Thiamine phosphate synthase n=1 Tax=Weissella confusa TaxID=1583 RepID=A0A923NCZ6_WEICO|nr:thiamine phosphate synthase [Weissella confusa]